MSRRTARAASRSAASAAALDLAAGVPEGGRLSWLRWLGILLLAVAVRIAFQVPFGRTPFADILFLDADHYDRWADSIAAGDWLGGDRPFFFDPGEAYLLALLKVLGIGHSGVRILQAFCGLGTVVLTTRLAERLGGARVAALAGVASALYLPLVFVEGLILKTSVEVFLGTAVAYAALTMGERPTSAWRWPLLGAAAGVATLFKSNFLIVIPVLVLWSAWLSWSGRARRPLLGPALLVGAFACTLSVATVRNWVVSREFVPLTYASGINFFIGNGPDADGSRKEPSFIRPFPEGEELDGNAEARRRAGRELSATEVSSFWWDQTTAGIAESPARWLRLLVVKARMYWNRIEVTDNISMAFVARWVPILRWPLPGFWLVAPLGLAGIAHAARRRDPRLLLVVALVIVQSAGVIMFHVADRYRLPIVPLLIALGSVAIVDVTRPSGRARTCVVGTLLAGILLVDVMPVPHYSSGLSVANHYEMLGVAHVGKHEGTEAIAMFERAVELEPGRSTAHHNLATALRTFRGDRSAAERELRIAVALVPTYGAANLALGQILFDAGRFAEAADVLRRAADGGAEPVQALSTAAAALGHLGRFDEALTAVRAALSRSPTDPHALQIRGNLLLSTGDPQGALESWERSLDGQPDNSELQANVDLLRRQQAAR